MQMLEFERGHWKIIMQTIPPMTLDSRQFFHMLLRNFTTDKEESSSSLLRSHYTRTEHCFSHSSDMLKFSLLFIVLILSIRESVMNSRVKRFLIFPRGNPTRHQVRDSRRNSRMQMQKRQQVEVFVLFILTVCRRHWCASGFGS